MVVRRVTRAAAVAEARPHVGFDKSGSLMRSEQPFENQHSNFMAHLRWRVRTEHLSPQDVVTLIGSQTEALRRMFAMSTMAAWSQLDRFWDWPLARGANSAEEELRSFGGRYPWLTDENAWGRMCQAAAQKHGHVLDAVRLSIDGDRSSYAPAAGASWSDIVASLMDRGRAPGMLERVADPQGF